MGESQGQNRIWENRPSGIAGGLWETQAKGELGSHSTIERVEKETLSLKHGAPSSIPTSPPLPFHIIIINWKVSLDRRFKYEGT